MTAWFTGIAFTALAAAAAWIRVTGARPHRAIARLWSARPRRARYRHRGEPEGLSAETRAAIRDWLRG